MDRYFLQRHLRSYINRDWCISNNSSFESRYAGWSVAIINSRSFGGTCALRGCDPKKVLVGAAEIIDWNRQTKSKGSSNPAPEIDWPDLLKFKRSFSEHVPKQRKEQFSKSRYNLCPGKGKLRG